MPNNRLNLLVAECEPAEARDQRRDSVGRSSGETYEAVLAHIAPGAEITRIKPIDTPGEIPNAASLADFDGVFLTGSPLHLYKETPETRRVVEFMCTVFDAGVPAFGSCAGLQVATVAAGGSVRAMAPRREAGFARRIFPTEDGRSHPLLRGRPPAYDAPAIHSDEVAALPQGALRLASNATTEVQAAEIRCGNGVFWGVQYHPEISLFEAAAALRREAEDLVEQDLATSVDAVEEQAQLVEALHDAPQRRDLAWRLGLDPQVTEPERRSVEIRNFIEHLVLPTRSRRGRG